MSVLKSNVRTWLEIYVAGLVPSENKSRPQAAGLRGPMSYLNLVNDLLRTADDLPAGLIGLLASPFHSLPGLSGDPLGARPNLGSDPFSTPVHPASETRPTLAANCHLGRRHRWVSG